MEKFYNGTEHFPAYYDEDALYILEIDPHHLYVFWHLKDKNSLKESCDPILLRLYYEKESGINEDDAPLRTSLSHQNIFETSRNNLSVENEKSYLEFQIKNSTNDYYIEIKESTKNYMAKLGYIEDNNFFIPLIESDIKYNSYSEHNEIQYPDKPNEPRWMRVDANTGTKDLLWSEYEKNDSNINNNEYEDKWLDNKNTKPYSRDHIIKYYKTLITNMNKPAKEYKKSKISLPSSLVPDIINLTKDKEYFYSYSRLLDKNFFDSLGISCHINFNNNIENHVQTVSRLTDKEKIAEYSIGYERKQ